MRTSIALPFPARFNATLSIALIGVSCCFPFPHEALRGQSSTPDSASREDDLVSEGRWGRVEYYEVSIEPPVSQLWSELFDERTIWEFPLAGKAHVIAQLQALGFSEAILEEFRTLESWSKWGNLIEVEPSDSIIEGMTAGNRIALSEWWRANHRPFFSKLVINLDEDGIATITRRLGAEKAQLVTSTIFYEAESPRTIDRAYLLRQMATEEEKKELIRTLFTNHTLIARLVVDADDDLDEIIEYWSGGGRNTAVDSILRGVQATPGVDRVDLVQLLPPIPRKYLYSFSKLQDINGVNAPDCFWTAYHFFQPHASNRPLDGLDHSHYVKSDFVRVEGRPTFGDLVMIHSSFDDRFIHSYIHITDEIVFTKNGANPNRPFTLSLRSIMMSTYDDGAPIYFEVYRRNRAL